jgi:putative DNA primase/helicase
MNQTDIERLARQVWGPPNPKHSTRDELRFGTHGSKSVNLKNRTWFDHEAKEGGGYADLYKKIHGQPPSDASIAAIYDYHDANGVLLFQVVRKVPKKFQQRRPDGNNRWHWNMIGVERVPYRLPELLKSLPTEWVFICEGEKDCDALHERKLIATTNPGGAGKWLPSMSTYLRGRDVVILPDNDPAGEAHAKDVADKLGGIARSIRVVRLPDLPAKGDVSDWLAGGGTTVDLQRLASGCEEETPERETDAETGGATDDANDHRPLIKVEPGKLPELATDGEQALIASRLPVFQRGRSLVRPIRQEVPASGGRTTFAAGLGEINVPAMIDLLAQAADWKVWNARKQRLVATDPPAMPAKIILSRAGQWRVPVVAGVVTTPTLRPDGTVLTAEGYDAITRLYHLPDPGLKLPSDIPDRQSRANAEEALALLDALLSEFPFVSATDRAVALSALITPIVRGAMTVVPLHAFRASTAGTGKSFLADLVSVIATGRPCPVIAAGQSGEETEKRLVGLILGGFPLISIDNCNGELGGDLLCQVVERPLIRIRPLGRSEIIEVESRATLFATGNALRMHGDMARRTLVCDLDAKMERPETRSFAFDPVRKVMAERGRYVAAALVVVRAYLQTGKPDQLSPVASFAEWSNLVRSPIVWLGHADPAASMEAAREDDPDLAELREIAGLWRNAFGTALSLTAREIVDQASRRKQDDFGNSANELVMPDLLDALVRVAGERGAVNTKRLGKWLFQHEGRIVDGHRLARAESRAHGGGVRWMLTKAGG